MRLMRAAAALAIAVAVMTGCATSTVSPTAAPVTSTGTTAAATTTPPPTTTAVVDATTKAALADVALTVDELDEGFVPDVPSGHQEYTALAACMGQTLTSDVLQGEHSLYASWSDEADQLHLEQYVVAYDNQVAVSVVDEIRAAAAACPDHPQDDLVWVNEKELDVPTPAGAEASHLICRAAAVSATEQWYACVATVARGRYLSWVIAQAPTVPTTQLLAGTAAALAAAPMAALPATG